jgi:thymidylate synthase
MNNLDTRYQGLLEDILHWGVKKTDRTGTGTISVFGRQIRHKMSEGFPLLTTKKMAWKTMVTELLWFLRGDTNIKFLVDNGCHIWDGDAYKNYLNETQHEASYTQEQFINLIKTNDDWAKVWGELGKIYGKQWRDWNGKNEVVLTDDRDENGYLMFQKTHIKGIDQIANLISELKTNPDSRRLMVNAWNVGELDQMVLPPCHYGFQVYTRELSLEERIEFRKKYTKDGTVDYDNRNHNYLDHFNVPTRSISLMWNQRSVDTFLGLPFNIASYALLLEIISKMVNMVPEELIGNLGDVHLYSNHIKQAKEQIARTPFELPKLNINTEFWPTESGSCGEGYLDATAVFNSFKDDNFCKCLLEEDIQLINYQSHPSIKAPLSN